MQTQFKFRLVAITFFIVLVISYMLCIAGGILLGWRMYQIWAPLLPGFTWPVTITSFIIGLAWIVGYSLYGAAILVLPYNYLMRRETGKDTF